MAIPVSVPYAFANATTTQNLSYLDSNFNALANGLNGLSNGASQISISSISATGTANSSTYLRGDGSWATISGGGGGVSSIDANSTIGFSFTGGPITSSGTLTLNGPSPGTSGNVLTSNGSAWISQASASGGGQFKNTLYATPGTYTWTAPAGVTSVRVTVIAGGGGGFGGATAQQTGGAGGSAIGVYTVVPGTGYTIIVGAGGSGVTSGTGGVGGTSSFGGVISATGGSGANSSANGTAGVGSSGTLNNSYANSYQGIGGDIPYFRIGGAVGATGSATNVSGKVYSPTGVNFAGACGWGDGTAGYGGVGGIVFLEYVG